MAHKFTDEEEEEMLREATAWEQSLKKERISPFLPARIVRELKARAEKQGKPYNLLLQEILEEYFFEGQSIEARLKKLEEKVFKKQA